MRNVKKQLLFPCLESPARFYLSLLSQDRRLTASPQNQMGLSPNRNEWDEWCLIPSNDDDDDDFSFAIQSVHHKTYLTCSEDGVVSVSKTFESLEQPSDFEYTGTGTQSDSNDGGLCTAALQCPRSSRGWER
jgi:hypothetical protein